MDIASKLWDHSVRTEKVIWLDGQTTCPTDELRTFFTDLDMTRPVGKDLWKSLTDGRIKWRSVAKRLQGHANREAVEELLGNLAGGGPKNPIGFLVQVATPMPRTFDEQGRRAAYHWGHYMTCWMHTRALDADFVAEVLAWKDEKMAALYYAKEKTKEKTTNE
jgi:integrase